MVLNAPFNNISVIPWPSVLLVEKTTDLSQVTDKYYRFLSYFLYYNNLNSSKHKKGDQEVKYYFFLSNIHLNMISTLFENYFFVWKN